MTSDGKGVPSSRGIFSLGAGRTHPTGKQVQPGSGSLRGNLHRGVTSGTGEQLVVEAVGFSLRVTRRSVALNKWVILEGGGLTIQSLSPSGWLGDE